ncbi:unnamed protein product [Heterobilharzia americana]|nr:unnamed protein product [Heterobilharzia americana]
MMIYICLTSCHTNSMICRRKARSLQKRCGETAKTGMTSDEGREDGGDEDTQSTTTTTTISTTRTNHHQQEESKGSCLLHLPTYLPPTYLPRQGSIVPITGGGTDEDVKARIGMTDSKTDLPSLI